MMEYRFYNPDQFIVDKDALLENEYQTIIIDEKENLPNCICNDRTREYVLWKLLDHMVSNIDIEVIQLPTWVYPNSYKLQKIICRYKMNNLSMIHSGVLHEFADNDQFNKKFLIFINKYKSLFTTYYFDSNISR